MRLETDRLLQNQLRLSREERDHIAGHALDSIYELAKELGYATQPAAADVAENHSTGSTCARKIAALSNLLGDIGWERSEAQPLGEGYLLGELFPVAQLRPWLEEWQREDNEKAEELKNGLLTLYEVRHPSSETHPERALRRRVDDALSKLGTGAIFLARIEKWMASHEN